MLAKMASVTLDIIVSSNIEISQMFVTTYNRSRDHKIFENEVYLAESY